MTQTVGTREILRNPSLLKIAPEETLIIEDKKAHKMLGMYIGVELAQEFMRYQEKAKLLKSAKKIASSAKQENAILEGALSDGL